MLASQFHTNMQRLIAIVLLLLALTGTFVPVAVAINAAPAHACCIRHAHHCHDSAVSSELTIRNTGCCNHDCCRAVATSQKAHPSPGLSVTFVQQIDGFIAESASVTTTQQLPTLQSPRAPPHTFVA
jgi:hypothetical protein